MILRGPCEVPGAMNFGEQAELWKRHQPGSKCAARAVWAAKMKLCEHARPTSNCAAGGGGAASGIYRVGAGGGKRTGDTGSVADAFFTWAEAGGIDRAGRARFSGRDVWMVFAGGNCGECRVLLCDFRFVRVFGYPPPRCPIKNPPPFARWDAFFEAQKKRRAQARRYVRLSAPRRRWQLCSTGHGAQAEMAVPLSGAGFFAR